MAEERGAAAGVIAAIVLAAGQSSRFGGPKQLARVHGKALLEQTLEALRASCIDDVVVVLGAHRQEIEREIRFDRERVVVNPDWASGMSTSIQAGLRAIDTAAALIVLGDQPFVAARTIDLLVDTHRRTRARAVIPTYHGVRGNPVLVDRSLFAEMMTLRGDAGFRAIFANHAGAIEILPVEDRGVVTDIDSPEDLARAEQGDSSRREG